MFTTAGFNLFLIIMTAIAVVVFENMAYGNRPSEDLYE